MNPRAPARAGLIIAIVLLAAVLVILLTNLIPLVADAGTVPSRSGSVNRGVTSMAPFPDAATRAGERARAWAGDAQLIRVEASWYISSDWQTMATPPVAWAFNYYSPATRSLAAAVIDDDTLLWVPAMEIPVVPAPLTTFPPSQDVEVAWLSFRAAGGESFLQAHPDAQVNFRLQQKPEGARWTVVAYGGEEFLKVMVDATTGVVLPPEVQE